MGNEAEMNQQLNLSLQRDITCLGWNDGTLDQDLDQCWQGHSHWPMTGAITGGWICYSRIDVWPAEGLQWMQGLFPVRFQPHLSSFQAEKHKKRREKKNRSWEQHGKALLALHPSPIFLLHSTNRTLTCDQAFFFWARRKKERLIANRTSWNRLSA